MKRTVVTVVSTGPCTGDPRLVRGGKALLKALWQTKSPNIRSSSIPATLHGNPSKCRYPYITHPSITVLAMRHQSVSMPLFMVVTFMVTAPVRAPAFLHIFVASCCRRCAGVGGRGAGGNSAGTTSDATAFLEQVLFAYGRARLSMMSSGHDRLGDAAKEALGVFR